MTKTVFFVLLATCLLCSTLAQIPRRSDFPSKEAFEQAMDEYEDSLTADEWFNDDLGEDPYSPLPPDFPYTYDDEAPRPASSQYQPQSQTGRGQPQNRFVGSRSRSRFPGGSAQAQKKSGSQTQEKSDSESGEQKSVGDGESKENGFGLSSNTSVIFGRLEVYSPDSLQARCLRTKGVFSDGEKKKRPTFVQGPCSYSENYMFGWDFKKNRLFPTQYPDLQLMSDAKERALFEAAYNLKFVTAGEAEWSQAKFSSSASTVKLLPRQFSVVSIANKNRDGFGFCLRVAGADRALGINAVPIGKNGDMSMCSLIRLVPLADDFSVGALRVKKHGKFYCATYRENAVPPASALYLTSCKKGNAKQLFLYNDVNGQLRVRKEKRLTTVNNNPLLFMWWSGGLRSYSNVPIASGNNYGWTIAPARSYGPVVSRDNRGYSGHCWMVDHSRDIVANQTCTLFKFIPKTLSLTQQIRENMEKLYNVAVMVQVRTPGGKIGCLSILRVLRQFAADDRSVRKSRGSHTKNKNGGQVSVFKLKFDKCDARTVRQRFILVTTQKNCVKKIGGVCLGHLRWVGDPSNSLVWMPTSKTSGLGVQSKSGRLLTPGPAVESQLPGQWQWSVRRFGHVTATHADGCWVPAPSKSVFFLHNTERCLHARVVPVQDLYNVPQDVVVVEEFRGSRTLKLSKSDTMDKQVRRGGRKSRGMADMYFSDFGYFGMRRMMRPAHGDVVTESGDVFLIQNQTLSFPFMPNPHLAKSDNGLITVRFQSPMSLAARVPRGQSFMLFSFAGRQGCLVYLTNKGGLGLRCRTSKGEQHCHFRFNNKTRLNDGKLHTVSLMYSATADFPHSIFVDTWEIGKCFFKSEIDMFETSGRLYFFRDPTNWQLGNFAGRIARVSVLTGHRDSLRQIASGKQTVYPHNKRLNAKPEKVAHPDTAVDSLGYGRMPADLESGGEGGDVVAPEKQRQEKILQKMDKKRGTARLETQSDLVKLFHQDTLHTESHLLQDQQQEAHALRRRRLLSVTSDQSEAGGLSVHRLFDEPNQPKAKKHHGHPRKLTGKRLKSALNKEKDKLNRLDKKYNKKRGFSSDDDLVEVKKRPRQVSAIRVGQVSTQWTNCEALTRDRNGTKEHYALQCQLEAEVTGYNLTGDLFSLGCSRPRCVISFVKDVGEPGELYFRYEPNYPADFNSENVGDPDPFPDVAMISDGFSTGRVSFGIQYESSALALEQALKEGWQAAQKEAAAKAKAAAALLPKPKIAIAEPLTALEVNSETTMADVCKYKMVQSCCARMVEAPTPIGGAEDDDLF